MIKPNSKPSLSTGPSYAVITDPLIGTATARIEAALVAKSSNAMVMRETRLPAVTYFPLADVSAELIPVPDFQTFCPFKGTARYFDVVVNGERYERGAWHYPKALPEARSVEGHVAFGVPVTVETDGSSSPAADRPLSGPLVEWMLRAAHFQSDAASLTASFGEALNAHGVAVSRISIMIGLLDPLVIGRNFVWSRDKGVETFSPSYDIQTDPAFVNSPLRLVSEGLGGVRQRLTEEEAEFCFPIMDELKRSGATDYVAMPLIFSDGEINVLTLTCDHPDGFTTANLGLVFELSGALARYFEVFTQRDNVRSILQTYVGPRTAERVLKGDIRRGDGEEMEAAIILCDLRNSTRLESELGRDAYLELLNRFFEACAEPIQKQGGEVLKFIGDAVLAVFSSNGDKELACANAANAARDILAAVDLCCDEFDDSEVNCAIGAAYGSVHYGNVGSLDRLDFTVTGEAANIAARLSDYGKTCGHRIIATGDIASTFSGALGLGIVDLKNVGEPVAAFALDKTEKD